MTGSPLLVVLGPSGNGKSTLGEALSAAFEVPFQDADALHPTANVAKMTAGIPLTDQDRAPWLATVHDRLAAHAATGLVMACSALKLRYRDILRAGLPQLGFVLPAVPKEVLIERVARRQGHYMPASLVDSQLAAFEPLRPEENGLTLDGTLPVLDLTDAVIAWLTPSASR